MTDPRTAPSEVAWEEEASPEHNVLICRVAVALGVLFVTLLALLVVPPWLTERNAALRAELVGVLAPAEAATWAFERHLAAEVAAARGFALTEDPSFAVRYRRAHWESAEALEELLEAAPQIGAGVDAAAQALAATWSGWARANLDLTEGRLQSVVFTRELDTQQRQHDEILGAAETLEVALTAELEGRRRSIQQSERARALATVVFVLMALLAAGGGGWMGGGLLRSHRRLRRRLREERALREIARGLNELSDRTAVLDLVADGALQLLRGGGAYVELAGPDGTEVEVVAVAGEGGLASGLTVPYPGSLTHEAIESGAPMHTSVEAMLAEGSQMGPSLAEVCAGCWVIAAPLHSEGAVLGAVVVTRAQGGGAFTTREADDLTLLCGMGALVLRRLQLFETSRRQARALRAKSSELREANETLERRVAEAVGRTQALTSELLMAEQRERRELAELLHDDLQQQLFGLQLQLQRIQRSLSDGGAEARVERAVELADGALRTTRQLAADISPPVLKGEGLGHALEWLGARVQERSGVRVQLDYPPTLTVPGEDMRVLLFQTVRELLLNVLRYTEATSVRVTVVEQEGGLLVQLGAEGGGEAAAERVLGGGLRRARARLGLFGGSVEVARGEGGGVAATVSVPLARLSR